MTSMKGLYGEGIEKGATTGREGLELAGGRQGRPIWSTKVSSPGDTDEWAKR